MNSTERDSRTNGPASSQQVDISGVISLTLEVVTLVSNTLPLLVLFGLKKRKDRTLTDFLIAVLATNDLLSVGLPLTIGLPSFVKRSWVGGRTSCRVYQVTTIFFQVSSMFLVVLMSIDRYLALFRPMFHRMVVQQSQWTRKVILGLLYSISLLVSCLPLIGLGGQLGGEQDDASEELAYCPLWLISTHTKGRHIYLLLLTCLGYATSIVIFVSNLAVLHKLREFKRRFKPTQTLNVHSNLVDKYSLISFAKLICVIGVLFYLTWIPVLVVLTMKLCEADVSELTAFYALTSLTINSLLHPVAIGIFSRQFRIGYKRIVCCCCHYIERHFSGYSSS